PRGRRDFPLPVFTLQSRGTMTASSAMRPRRAIARSGLRVLWQLPSPSRRLVHSQIGPQPTVPLLVEKSDSLFGGDGVMFPIPDSEHRNHFPITDLIDHGDAI